MPDVSVIFILAVVTLGAGLAYGFWQMRRAERARQRNEDAAITSNEK